MVYAQRKWGGWGGGIPGLMSVVSNDTLICHGNDMPLDVDLCVYVCYIISVPRKQQSEGGV